MAKKRDRVGEADIRIPALLAARAQPDGYITTSKLIEELSATVKLGPEDEEILDNRQDTRFSQIVRNIKSHKTTPGNLICDGYFEEAKGGFRITEAGLAYLKSKGD